MWSLFHVLALTRTKPGLAIAYLCLDVFEKTATKHRQFLGIGKHVVNSTSLHPALPKGATPSWTRSGIRGEVSIARVLTYAHLGLSPGTALKKLAYDLLQAQFLERDAGSNRPLFFICHSIGGLVVKLALVEPSRNSKFHSILDHCYGVAFFGENQSNDKVSKVYTNHRTSYPS